MVDHPDVRGLERAVGEHLCTDARLDHPRRLTRRDRSPLALLRRGRRARCAKRRRGGARAPSTRPRAALESPLPAHKRAEILVKVAGLIGRRHEEVARTICEEAGKPIKTARVEASRAMSTYTFAAVEARKLAGEMIPMDAAQAGEGKLAFTLRAPIGVVGAISPFNFPCNLVAHKLAPALGRGLPRRAQAGERDAALGAAARRARAARRACPPAGSTSLVGPASEIGDVLVEDERVTLITFTGSGEVGWKLQRARAAQAREARARQLDAGDRRRRRRRRDGGRASSPRTPSPSPARAASPSSGSTSSARRYDAFVAAFVPKVEALEGRRPGRRRHRRRAGDRRGQPRARILAWIGASRRARCSPAASEDGLVRPTVIANVRRRRQGRAARRCSARRDRQPRRLARRGDRARERHALRPPGRRLHRIDRHGAARGRPARLRRRHRQRGADVPQPTRCRTAASRRRATRRKAPPMRCAR